ncbi:MAG: N-formylglutamate amidohydrolase [Planctomycetota bacterium]|nr:N-formylglutamate amidohydrolase [Planctomycetota bacterium]
MSMPLFEIQVGNSPIIAAAIHDGHDVRPELELLFKLGSDSRLIEEDPHTAYWASVSDNRIIGLRSRFEVDLNRPRDKAVYRKPEDAWGLDVWSELPAHAVEESLSEYDRFYAIVKALLKDTVSRHGYFVVLDLHTYNHRRAGPNAEPADPDTHPEVNLGTESIDKSVWSGLVQRFRSDLSGFDFIGRHLDVRENVKFKGGNFSRWIHETFPGKGCSLAVEFKKFFMDEWTGEKNTEQVNLIWKALRSTLPGLMEGLGTLKGGG